MDIRDDDEKKPPHSKIKYHEVYTECSGKTE